MFLSNNDKFTSYARFGVNILEGSVATCMCLTYAKEYKEPCFVCLQFVDENIQAINARYCVC